MIQSPVTYRQNRNEPIGSKKPTRRESVKLVLGFDDQGDPILKDDLYDDFEDLKYRQKIVGVAISGGGARAAYFSAAILKKLEEKYAAKHSERMTDAISFYSSVSGGSITNAFIGSWYEYCGAYDEYSWYAMMDQEACKSNGFEWSYNYVAGKNTTYECGNLSNIATRVVLSPGGLGMPFLYTVFSNQGYSRYLSFAMDMCLTHLLQQRPLLAKKVQ